MTDDLTDESLAALLHGFQSHTLPAAEWTHHAHLLTALMLARRLPEAELMPALREGISSYNLSTGNSNTETSGYHESITAFYAAVMAAYARATADMPLTLAAARLLASPLAGRDILLRAYDAETLKTVEARLGYRPPDRPDFRPDQLVQEVLAP